jgi:hypothetical protein
VYDHLAQRRIAPVIPPQHNAKIKQHGNAAAEPLPRDEAIRGRQRSSDSEFCKCC